MQVHGIAVVLRQGAHRIEHTAVFHLVGRGDILIQFGVLLARCTGQVPAAVDGDTQQPGLEVLLTLKAAVVVQELFENILHHIFGVRRAAAIVVGCSVDGVAVSLHSQRKNFVFGQLSHIVLHSFEAPVAGVCWKSLVPVGHSTGYTAERSRLLHRRIKRV